MPKQTKETKYLYDTYPTHEKDTFVGENPMAKGHTDQMPTIGKHKGSIEGLLSSGELDSIKSSIDGSKTSPATSTASSIENRPPFRAGGKPTIRL